MTAFHILHNLIIFINIVITFRLLCDFSCTGLFFCCQDPRGKSHRASRILDHILLKRPDEDFAKLCEALINTNQRHVVDRWLTPGGRDRTDLAPEHAPPVPMDVDEAELSKFNVPEWRELIVRKRNEIVDELEPNEDLLNDLLKYGVMNVYVYEVLKVSVRFSFPAGPHTTSYDGRLTASGAA